MFTMTGISTKLYWIISNKFQIFYTFQIFRKVISYNKLTKPTPTVNLNYHSHPKDAV